MHILHSKFKYSLHRLSKRCYLFSMLLLLGINVFSQGEFITIWQLNPTQTQINFNIQNTSGVVDYTWETIPAGSNGSGSFPANSSNVSITNLPTGAKIKLLIKPQNLERFYIGGNYDNLIDVVQWGSANWKSMSGMFSYCRNLIITASDTPNLSQVTDMSYMFISCYNFNSNINHWDVSNVTDMSLMFHYALEFNQPLNNWNVSKVTNMSDMFFNAEKFNQPLNNWNVSNVIYMHYMFYDAESFNQPLNNWNTQNVERMDNMFSGASSFNQPLNNWNTQNVEIMEHMFFGASSFNQPLNNWNVSNVTDMGGMFFSVINFNQPLNNWNVENVTDMSGMFNSAINFNQPLNNWDVSMVTTTYNMFSYATAYNQNLGSWNLKNNPDLSFMLDFSGIDCENYKLTLEGWANNSNTPNNLHLGAEHLIYDTDAIPIRNFLINNKGWQIVADIYSPGCKDIVIATIYDTICNGNSILFNGQNLTASGIYYDTFPTPTKDSIVALNLLVNDTIKIYNPQSICNGDSYILNNKVYTSSGTYFDTLYSSTSKACDTIIETELTVNNSSTFNNPIEICTNQSYFINGHTYTLAGTYRDTLFAGNSVGCDSIIITQLTVTPILQGSKQATFCEGSFYTLPSGKQVNMAGTYRDTIKNSAACDSVIITQLTEKKNSNTTFYDSICSNEIYNFFGRQLNTTGIYIHNFINAANGCDSLVTLNLTVNPTPTIKATATPANVVAQQDIQLNIETTATISNIIWKPADVLNSPNSSNPIAKIIAPTWFVVQVSNELDCSSSDSVFVGIADVSCLLLPNVFTPNGNGRNETFKPLGSYLKQLIIFRIFDRWGNIVFETNDLTIGWDGTFKGNILDAGSYHYYIEGVCTDGRKEFLKGDITLIR